MKKSHLVVIGNGMAGMRTLEELLKIAPDLYHITVFGAEPYVNYNRILLSPVLAGEQSFEEIVLNDAAWYAEHHITLHLGAEITAIDRHQRTVRTRAGVTVHYDRLLLATGSKPFMLPIPGAHLRGVIPYRDIDDTQQMITRAASAGQAVVIGGGLLGLEAANGLKARGMSVTVVHLMETLMERQLDATAGGLLQRALEQRGVAFVVGASTAAILGDENQQVTGVQLADGRVLPAALVVMAIGIRPNTALAETAGLHCARGIVVNDTLQTYDPRIYAVGECVNHRGIAYGLVAPLFEMARVAANHLAEFGTQRYGGSVTATKLKVTGIDLFSAGDFIGDESTDAIVLSDPANGVYKKLVLKDDRLVGSVLYGDTAEGSWYFKLMREGRSVAEIRDRLMFGERNLGDAGHLGQNQAAAMSDEMEVCGCNGVSKGQICQDRGCAVLRESRDRGGSAGIYGGFPAALS